MTLPTDLIAYTRAMLLPALTRCKHCGHEINLPHLTGDQCSVCWNDAKGPFEFDRSDE